jgi:hypothetical protein
MSILLLFLSNAFLAWDMIQTLDIKTHPELHETNKLLGPHPEDARVSVYFVLIMHANILLWLFLHPIWRDLVPSAVLVVEAVQVYRNVRTLRRIHENP